MFRLLVGAVVLACLVAATPTLCAKAALSLRVTPQMTTAPATVSITVSVEPNEKNRVLVIEDDSELYYRSSQIQLDGQHAARTHVLTFRGLPAGEHQVSASVHRAGGVHAVVRSTVTVAGSAGLWR